MSKRKEAPFTQGDADQARVRFLAAGHAEGYRSVTDLIEAAVLREVKRLQRKHNQGGKWEPVRPRGAAPRPESPTSERPRSKDEYE